MSRVSVLLATIQLKVQSRSGEFIQARALLDQGSEILFVSEILVQHLRIDRHSESVSIIGIGGQQREKSRGVAVLKLKSRFNDNKEIRVVVHILPKLTSTIPTCQVQPSWSHLLGLPLADPDYHIPGPIDLLLGVDVYSQIIEADLLKGPLKTPIAQKTAFGWIVSGIAQNTTESRITRNFHCSIDHELYNLLEKFWIQEQCPHDLKDLLTSEETECENHFISTHKRDDTGRYIVRIPLKLSPSLLGDSFSSASRILAGVSRKLCLDAEYRRLYCDFLDEYKKMGHMKLVSPSEVEPNQVFYSPHHGVLRKTSITTKLRVVFNGSKPSTSGISLNDIVHTGQKLQTDLVDVILWFRQFKYTFTADMEKMYRQINVHQADWNLQRILWLNNSGELEKYQLTTVTYGLACAPFLAMRVMHQLIQDEGHKFPLAIDVLKHGRYVDDVFGGGDTIKQVQDIVSQVDSMCMAGCFPLQKWVSNDNACLESLPIERLGTEVARKIQEQSIVHALGLSWNPRSDNFQFSDQKQNEQLIITKRTILSQIAQLFDPLGFVAPVTIRAKIFLQDLWLLKLGWDQELPSSLANKWINFKSHLSNLSRLSIPRWMGISSNAYLEIHGFSDASQEAIASVVYIRSQMAQEETPIISLVMSKTKVAPLKRLTIPRLELSAAVLLTRLVSHIIRVLNLHGTPIILWTNSSIVHTWINNHPSRWKEFVHNRVCLIQEKLPTAQWRLIPGKMNPADCATRGLSPEQLLNHDLWWSGPDWLKQSKHNWPLLTPTTPSSKELEERPATVLTTSIKTHLLWELIHKYSSLTRLLRITAICRRVILIFKKLAESITVEPISIEEIDWAKQFWCLQVQQSEFPNERKLLQEGQPLSKSSSMYRFTPFLDSVGLIRIGGRLHNSPLDYPVEHPIILPRRHPFSNLLISSSHLRTLHGGTQVTLNDLRNYCWILGGRAPIRSFILKCVKCSRFRGERAKQLMGRGSRNYKAYFALFVCFATSAIHIELVTDYTTESFIAAYKRFTSRRGICATLFSDCGTNFIGANSELRQNLTNAKKELGKLASSLSNDGTKWIFNPPASPHFGGKWEAGVKSVKYHLKRIVGDTILTYEEMTTLLNQIEAILNSRPLCPLSDDPDDLTALTPGHFLIGDPLITIPEPSLASVKISRMSRWQLTRHMLEKFWNQWSKSCLQRYQANYKWTEPSTIIKKGTLVLITDERLSPSKWPLARVIELHPGSDFTTLTRVVTVKTQTSTFKRPIVKLCPLPIQVETT